MIWICITACLLLATVAAACFSPLRQHLLQLWSKLYPRFQQSPSLVCQYLRRTIPVLDQFRFRCRVEPFSDESQPAGQDQFFRVQITGRIPTEQDGVDTDVQVEVTDITEGPSNAHQVLSTDEHYRTDENAVFHLIRNNGVVPDKNAVLTRWITVTQFPCHILRLAFRGRRKLQFRATVIEVDSGYELVSGQKTIEYVYCADGYREVHGRHLEVLQSCIELSAVALGAASDSENVRDRWAEWILEKAEMFMSANEAVKVAEDIQNRFSDLTMQHSSNIILAYGENTDRFSAIELVLQMAACQETVSKKMLARLFDAAEMLEIQRDRFLGIAQKLLLPSDCRIEDPSQLLGINADMDDESFRKQLNEEYRKWNARVTHPNAEIRTQADQILTLIAEVRSQWLQTTG